MSGINRIQLRLKAHPDVVLPEAFLISKNNVGSWNVQFRFDSAVVALRKADWEEVPPPFVLPEGIGAVVDGKDGFRYVRISKALWVAVRSKLFFEDRTMQESNVPGFFTLRSEGVEL